MANPKKAVLTRAARQSLRSYAEALARHLKDPKAYLAPVYVEEQMLLPTMEVYLSTEIPLSETPSEPAPKRPRVRHKAPATVRAWERLF